MRSKCSEIVRNGRRNSCIELFDAARRRVLPNLKKTSEGRISTFGRARVKTQFLLVCCKMQSDRFDQTVTNNGVPMNSQSDMDTAGFS